MPARVLPGATVVDDPVKDYDGGDGAVATEAEVCEESQDSDGPNCNRVQDASSDEEILALGDIGPSDDDCAIGAAFVVS
jgi:hypothetical protein